MSDPSQTDQNHNDHGGLGKYVVVFLALCILTGASSFTASDFWTSRATPHITWVFTIAVSCTKAMLVIMFFMHLFWEANWKYMLTIPASIVSLILVLVLVPDVGWRMDHASREREMYMAIEKNPDVEHRKTHGAGEAKEQGEPSKSQAELPMSHDQ